MSMRPASSTYKQSQAESHDEKTKTKQTKLIVENLGSRVVIPNEVLLDNPNTRDALGKSVYSHSPSPLSIHFDTFSSERGRPSENILRHNFGFEWDY